MKQLSQWATAHVGSERKEIPVGMGYGRLISHFKVNGKGKKNNLLFNTVSTNHIGLFKLELIKIKDLVPHSSHILRVQ